jgi:hypothetical protein
VTDIPAERLLRKKEEPFRRSLFTEDQRYGEARSIGEIIKPILSRLAKDIV